MTADDISIDETWSGEDQIYDYLTIPGLNTKFGLNGKDYDIFIIQQVLDNALDFIEQNAKKFVNAQNPYVSIIITEEEEDGKVTKIRVRNSNAGISNLFPQEHIDKIFKLDRYQSSKRYRHKINRGELGDAFKAILGIPYALVINNDDGENWDYPLEINILNDNRSIKIKIDNIDKIRRRENPKVIQQEYDQITDQEFGESESESEENINDSNNNFTEVVVYLPTHSIDYRAIHDILKKYIIDNTHINFNIQLPGQKEPRFYKATQELYKDWKNKQSVYSYTLQDIKGLFYSIDKRNDDVNVFDNFIRTDFREGTTLTKDEDFKTLTFGDLRKDDKKIEQVVQKLKNNQKPIKYQSTSLQKLEAPFDWKLREEALKKRLKQVYKVDEEDFVYKRFDKYYEHPNNGVQFPFKLEVVIAKSPILEENVLTLIESLNFSPSLNQDLFSTNDSIFFWKNYKAESILDILSDCGYSIYNNGQHKKPYNLMFVNLISPRIDYNNFSKSNINLLPFAETFSNEFYKFCKFASTKRNKNNGRGNGNDNKNTDNTYHLRIWLNERLEAVKKDPTLLTTGRVTLDGVYYRLRTKLDRMGIPVKERSHIKSSIKDICDEMGYKRDELGIIAAERAQFYFRGRSYGVGIDVISELAKYATDLIIIEKEGAVEALAPFADKKGIALVYTRGFGTEYALDLSEKTESNIAVLTDLDASGLLIAAKLPSNKKTIHRIGIDQRMLDYFGLDFDDLSETYTPQEGHYDTVAKYLIKNNYNLISNDLFKRLKTERVEIDSVLSKVSNEDFWNYIIEFLEEKFPNRNYNRSIDVPKFIMPKKIEEFITNLNARIGEIQAREREKIVKELENVEGFIEEDNIEQTEEEINDRLMSVAESDQ